MLPLSKTNTNLALYKPVTVSSARYAVRPGSSAVDGISATRWESNYSDQQWLYVDLMKKYAIDTIIINWENAYGKDFDLQVSDNSVNWITVRSETGNTAVNDTFTNLNTSGRYVRMYGKKRATAFGYSIYEMKIYAPNGANKAKSDDALIKNEKPVPVQSSITVSPNPATSDIHFLFQNINSKTFSVTLNDVNGKPVLQQILQTNNAGTYELHTPA